MKAYVLAFIFDEKLENVWLIKKNRPDWQADKMNGIGGKFEESDGVGPEGFKNAIIRELREESGIKLNSDDLQDIGCLYSISPNALVSEFVLEVFTGKTDKILETKTDEEIFKVRVDELKQELSIENVPALIELSKLYLTAKVPFKNFEIEY